MRSDWFYIAGGREDPNIQHPDGRSDAIIKYLSVVQNYLINVPDHRDASKQQSCQNLTHLSCLASYCHKWKEVPIIPDWNEFWNVFIIKCENLFTQEPAGIILSFYNLPEITLGGGPHIVTVSGMRGIIVNTLIDSPEPRASIKRESRNIQLNKLNQFNPKAISSQFKDQTFDNCFEMKMKQTICQIGT